MSLSLLIVPDEWLIHDLHGENGEDKQKETFSFLEKVINKCDKLVILDGSPFMEKFYRLLAADSRPQIRAFSKFMRESFLLNPEKCKLVGEHEIQELPQDWKSKIQDEDDFYLFQILRNLPGSVLITTDEGLRNLSLSPDISIRLRDEFLKKY